MLREKDILMRELQTALRVLARLLKLNNTEISNLQFDEEESESTDLSKLSNLLTLNELNTKQYDLAKAILHISLIRQKAFLEQNKVNQTEFDKFKTAWQSMLTLLESKSGIYDFELEELKNK